MNAPARPEERARHDPRRGDGPRIALDDVGSLVEPRLEIGATLRRARVSGGFEVHDVAEATKIPARFLHALEEDRFGELPPGLYVRSFLREYAEFVGLDCDVYEAEYEARFAPPEPEPPAPPPRSDTWLEAMQPRRALALVLLVAAGIGVWQLGSPGSPQTVKSPSATTPPRHARAAGAPHHPAPGAVDTPPAAPPRLTLAATRGNCWLLVEIRSGSGPVVYEQTLHQGETVRFGLRSALRVRLGAPWNVEATIGRRRVTAALPRGPGDVVVSTGGVRPAS